MDIQNSNNSAVNNVPVQQQPSVGSKANVATPVESPVKAKGANDVAKLSEKGAKKGNGNATDQQLSRDSEGVAERVLIEAIEKANRKLYGASAEYSFSVHEATKQIMIKVTDKDTGEVIKEIPSQKALDAVAMMWEFAGLLVDEKR